MADIFISYSSHDREQAKQLTELLTSAGLSVWIDQAGIDVATSWSEEIVEAIDLCTAFVVMLSPHSIASGNVVKEVSLASEKHKKILPLDLEPVELPKSLQYALAGIQRAPMTNIDAIIRALGKLGLDATQAPTLKLVKETDSRKSLMILPFEDMSPTGDNGWFADGLASELISALSNVKALRVTDAQGTKDFKRYQGTLPKYAQEMGIRYFVQGDVRKFGDNIKITSRLLDIETGDHLWQDSMKGTMNDIFDIQEKVAEKVVEGLKVHLASDEKKKLAERGTENAEAYELYMKAGEYFNRRTKQGFQLAIQLLTESIKLDPGNARAYQFKANALTALYGTYDRTPTLLDEAEWLCKEALRLNANLFTVYGPLSKIYIHRGQLAEAEETAREFIRKDPQNSSSHLALGYFYWSAGQPAKAIAPIEEAIRLEPDSLASLLNLVAMCDSAGEREKCKEWAPITLPLVERHLKLHPDDEGMRVQNALLIVHSGRTDEAYATAMKLTNLKDGSSLYNTACLLGRVGDKPEALRTFRKAIEAGFRNIRILKEFLTDEKEGILALQGTPEYEEVKRMVEKIEQETNPNG
jgi:TolB-like protein/Flp pilus assembly protein TadD